MKQTLVASLVLALGAASCATGAAVAVVAATAVWAAFWAVLFVRIERSPGGAAPSGEADAAAGAVAPEDEAKLVVS